MSAPSIRIEELPRAWFSRPQYEPRLGKGAQSEWFLLQPEFLPAAAVPEAPPVEPPVERRELHAAFEETYRRWRLPRAPQVVEALEALVERRAAAIVTGQQPGFLGGPLFTLYKALSAIAAARRYRERTGRPCVAVFWVAAEDHDLEEVREARLPAAEGGEASFRYPHAADRRPLADYPIDAGALVVLEAAKAHLGRRLHAARAAELIDLYRGGSLASGFAALHSSLLGHTGLLVLDPETLRPIAAPLIRRVLEDPAAILARIEEGREEVRRRGLEPQVGGRFPLFLLRGGKRHSLAPEPDGGWRVGDGSALSSRELLGLFENDPRVFSSGALLRPLVERHALPSLLTVGGPAEVAYFAQLGPLARHLGLEPPACGLRLDATLLEGKIAETAAALSSEDRARARDPRDLLPREEESAALKALREMAPRLAAALERALGELSGSGSTARLRRRAETLRGEANRLVEDVAAARAGAAGVELERVKKLWNFVFPGGMLQERRWNVLHFVARHGTAWLDDVLEALHEDPLRIVHRWITFPPESPQ